MNCDQILRVVDAQCGHPDQHRPTLDDRMIALRKCAQALHNDMQNQLPGWDLISKDVTAGPGNTLVNFDARAFGKIRRVYAMETGDQNSPYTYRVERIDPDALGRYQGLSQYAQVVAPFFKDNVLKLQFAPELTTSAEYRVWYEVGAIEELATTSQALRQVESYNYLLADMVTQELLPKCWWSWLVADNPKMAMKDQLALQKMHANSLLAPINLSMQTQWPMWKEHIASLTASSEPTPNPYGGEIDFDDPLYFAR